MLFLFHFCSFWTIFHTLLQTYFPRNIFQNLNNPKNVHAQKLNKQKYYIVQASNKGRWLPIVKFGWLFCSHNSRFFFLLVQLLNSLTRLSESYDIFCSLSAGPKCFFNRDLSHHLHGADQIFGIQRRDFFFNFFNRMHYISVDFLNELFFLTTICQIKNISNFHLKKFPQI